MSDSCPLCRRPFARHFAVRALCAARWRGASFDAAQAKGNMGLAVADALGVSPRDSARLAGFMATVVVEAYREVEETNPAEPYDPREEGEWWEFHAGFLDEVPGDVLERAAEAAVAAVERTRNYSRAGLVATG